ncbi:MAG: 50S ribosomal protein L11 methyltransferase [Armatimonadota bacterium]|nr:50S ribosomal protein L11 methyltransferase [Armatimonadota bacterium]
MRWTEVSVRVPPSQAAWAADVLLRHCPRGLAEVSEGTPRRRILRAYLPVGRAGRTALARLRRELAPVTPTTRTIDDRIWLDAWKARARPIAVGRVLVVPSGMPLPATRGRVVLRVDPGMAFGSGEHPTTQLCLAAVERLVRRGAVVIDLGTGSGVLAIAAARLGASRVLALDNDPVAVETARANVRANRVGARVTVRQADGLRGVRLRADLIVANLTAQTLAAVAPDLRRCLAPGGRIVGSGFAPARAREVARGFEAAGLRLVGTEHLRGWSAVHAAA